MRTGKYYLSLSVAIGILCVSVFGEVEPAPRPGEAVSPSQRGGARARAEQEPLLIGQPEPALRGIRQLYIVVLAPDTEPNSHGLVFAEIEKLVKEKIKDNGITVAETDLDKMEPNSTESRAANIKKRRIENTNARNLKFKYARIPELRIDVDVLDMKDPNQVVFYVKTSLARLVYLGRDNRPGFKTDVWRSEPIMQAASIEGMPAAVSSAVMEQVEAFIHAYLAANPPHRRSSDANDVGEATKEQDEPAAESMPAEYEYVASKNSDVFHKPDCSSAKRIKAENLVYYNSRDEAIKSGKRPCGQCNP